MTAIRIILASALITTAAIKAAPALAEPLAPQPAVVVSVVPTADLDLSTEAGQRQLDIRLSHAAREVCGAASVSDLQGRNDVRKCRNDALAGARGQREQLLAGEVRGRPIAVTAGR